MKKPIIGISLSAKHEPENERNHGTFSLCWNYAEGIVNAGGIPIGITPITDPMAAIEMIDGWLIPGGDDIDPAVYGQARHEKAELVCPRRYEGEVALFRATPLNMPILGICYGCQFLNVQFGGSLHQHLPDIVGNDDHRGGTLATYAIVEGTKLHNLLKSHEVQGRSYHHQAIDRVGQGLAVNAKHADGTIEGIEAPDRPWLIGIQWHPERTLSDIETVRLFEAFVEACARYRFDSGKA